MLTDAEIRNLVKKQIALLKRRKGFDEWWDSIREDIQEGIKDALFAEIKTFLVSPCTSADGSDD